MTIVLWRHTPSSAMQQQPDATTAIADQAPPPPAEALLRVHSAIRRGTLAPVAADSSASGSGVAGDASAAASSARAAPGQLNSFCTRASNAVYIVGLMSGTSLDGVDAVVARFPTPTDPSSSSAAEAPSASTPSEQPQMQMQMVAHHFLPMPSELRGQLLALNTADTTTGGGGGGGGGELHRSALASNALALLYGEAVGAVLQKASLRPSQILAIGCHGQTVRHAPAPSASAGGYTVQLGNHALLAETTGIPVVADFRTRDIAAGGQGAPLVPAFHQAFFGAAHTNNASSGSNGSANSGIIVLNLGGIANVSWIRSPQDHGTGQQQAAVLGFDTGPANVLTDLWIQAQNFPAPAPAPSSTPAPAASSSSASSPSAPAATAATLQYDADGAWASTGRVLPGLLDRLLSEPYFGLSPPKSTGRDLFNWAWLAAQGLQLQPGGAAGHRGDGQKDLAVAHAPQDVQATLVELTARSVAQAIERFCTTRTDADAAAAAAAADGSTAMATATTNSLDPVYVCGGGARNSFMMRRLSALLPGRVVQTTMQARGGGAGGIEPECVEAFAFAWLAHRFLHGLPANMPAVTGAKGLRILGAYYPA